MTSRETKKVSQPLAVVGDSSADGADGAVVVAASASSSSGQARGKAGVGWVERMTSVVERNQAQRDKETESVKSLADTVHTLVTAVRNSDDPLVARAAQSSTLPPQATAAAGTREDGREDPGQAQPAHHQSTPCTAAPGWGPASVVEWNPPTPPPLLPGTERRCWRCCNCQFLLPEDLPWEEATEIGWPCPIWCLTPELHPPGGGPELPQSRWAQLPWVAVQELSYRRAAKVLRCTCFHIWAGLDIGQRTRRQLAAQAAEQRTRPHHLRGESEPDSEADYHWDYHPWPYLTSEDYPESD